MKIYYDTDSSYPVDEVTKLRFENKELKNTLYGITADNRKLRRECARLRKLYARWRNK